MQSRAHSCGVYFLYHLCAFWDMELGACGWRWRAGAVGVRGRGGDGRRGWLSRAPLGSVPSCKQLPILAANAIPVRESVDVRPHAQAAYVKTLRDCDRVV